MAARTRKTTLNDKWRERIRTSMLINRLESHVLGEVELSASQVSAALGLLKKTAPDLSVVDGTMEHKGEVEHVHRTAESLPLNDIRSKASEVEQRTH